MIICPQVNCWERWRPHPGGFGDFGQSGQCYRPSVLDDDLTKLREVYRNEGFLDVSIEQNGVAIIPRGTGKLDIVIKIEEGKRSYFGQSLLVGNVVLSTPELLEDSSIRKGNLIPCPSKRGKEPVGARCMAKKDIWMLGCFL